jgi:hypothetical protein
VDVSEMLETLSVKYNSGRPTEGEPVTGKTGTAGSEEGVRKRTVTATRLAPILQAARKKGSSCRIRRFFRFPFSLLALAIIR